MNNEQRRIEILSALKESVLPISASAFAKDFSVTRQIIVADIALLRASGYPIRAEHKGYVLEKVESNEIRKRIVVKHGAKELTGELYAVVDNGGRVIDVIVEHSIYGKISAELNLSSRYEIDLFVKKVADENITPLSLLTDGLHIHTIAVKDLDSYERIVEKLKELKVLVECE
jgi:transcriptional regulator of NAD metabolism